VKLPADKAGLPGPAQCGMSLHSRPFTSDGTGHVPAKERMFLFREREGLGAT
jgi:hypothetical protein